MAGKCLLDTNIVIALFGGDETVVSRIQQMAEVYVPAVVMGELYYGAFNSGKPEINLARIDQFSSNVNILDSDSDTGKRYGQIKKTLKEQGTPIPENDIWIAASAVRHSLPLITRDKHFHHIPALQIESW